MTNCDTESLVPFTDETPDTSVISHLLHIPDDTRDMSEVFLLLSVDTYGRYVHRIVHIRPTIVQLQTHLGLEVNMHA